MFSFVVCGIARTFVGLCYAELAALLPVSNIGVRRSPSAFAFILDHSADDMPHRSHPVGR
jgi:hypothetical protein